jgi:hypothetical protein
LPSRLTRAQATECGDSRYLAIPFFDTCLSLRLPEKGEDKHRPVDVERGWLAGLECEKVAPAQDYLGDRKEAAWLPNEAVARAWSEYVATRAVGDRTPPPSPIQVKTQRKEDGSIDLTWDVRADFESGIGGFKIEREDMVIAKLPEKPSGRFGRPLFQTMSYHDTPERPLPFLLYHDREAPAEGRPVYRAIAINGVGLESAPSEAAGPS